MPRAPGGCHAASQVWIGSGLGPLSSCPTSKHTAASSPSHSQASFMPPLPAMLTPTRACTPTLARAQASKQPGSDPMDTGTRPAAPAEEEEGGGASDAQASSQVSEKGLLQSLAWLEGLKAVDSGGRKHGCEVQQPGWGATAALCSSGSQQLCNRMGRGATTGQPGSLPHSTPLFAWGGACSSTRTMISAQACCYTLTWQATAVRHENLKQHRALLGRASFAACQTCGCCCRPGPYNPQHASIPRNVLCSFLLAILLH